MINPIEIQEAKAKIEAAFGCQFTLEPNVDLAYLTFQSFTPDLTIAPLVVEFNRDGSLDISRTSTNFSDDDWWWATNKGLYGTIGDDAQLLTKAVYKLNLPPLDLAERGLLPSAHQKLEWAKEMQAAGFPLPETNSDD